MNSGGGDVRSSEFGIDAELAGESFGLSLGRDDVEGRATQCLCDLNDSTSKIYACVLSTCEYGIK